MFPVGRCEVNIAKLLPVGRAEKPFFGFAKTNGQSHSPFGFPSLWLQIAGVN